MLTVLSLLSLAQVVTPTLATPPPTAASSSLVDTSSPIEALPPAVAPTPASVHSSERPAASRPITPEMPVPADRLAPLSIPQSPSQAPAPVRRSLDIVRAQAVRPLPGQLDDVPVFNSNSPELIQTEGILLSTFPKEGKRVPQAHLNYPLQGRFDLFAHHIAKGLTPDDVRTLYLGVVVYNPGDKPVTLDILQAVSYLSQDAPFADLPAYVANPMGNVYAGPGSRATSDVLRGERQQQWPAQVVIPPRHSQLLVNVPIPLRRLTVPTDGTLPPGYALLPSPPPPTLPAAVASTTPTTGAAALTVSMSSSRSSPSAAVRPTVPVPSKPDNRPLPINGRSILMHLASDGPVYMASLAMYAPKTANGSERVPYLAEWENLLVDGGFAGPRDRSPTPPDTRRFTRFFYGRVSGVSRGSQWSGIATDNPKVDFLTIPDPGQAISYALSTVDHNTFGTGQIQSAPMLVRYPDTAYRAHGNYGTQYNISLPLTNSTDATRKVAIMLETPLQNEQAKNALSFRNPPDEQIFFRGTVRLRYTDDLGIPQTRYIHVIQRRGQQGDPLIRLTMPPGDRRLVEVQLIYPPDATPPQVLTIETQEMRNLANAQH